MRNSSISLGNNSHEIWIEMFWLFGALNHCGSIIIISNYHKLSLKTNSVEFAY